jgi:hypothetical protein
LADFRTVRVRRGAAFQHPISSVKTGWEKLRRYRKLKSRIHASGLRHKRKQWAIIADIAKSPHRLALASRTDEPFRHHDQRHVGLKSQLAQLFLSYRSPMTAIQTFDGHATHD